MKAFLIIAIWSIAAGASAGTADSNCYIVFNELRCTHIQLEPKPPIGGPPRSADSAGQQCRDAAGKLTACPAAAPKQCRDANGRAADCGTPGAKPT